MVLQITNVRFSSIPRSSDDPGLIGFVSCTLAGSVLLDGIALRRTSEGSLTLSFPARIDRSGHRHFIVRPQDDGARLEIERQIFKALGFEKGAV